MFIRSITWICRVSSASTGKIEELRVVVVVSCLQTGPKGKRR